MKIEIGESLVYSWLRHVKMCRVVQTNWKPSRMWPLENQDKLDTLMRESKEHFQTKYSYHIYKENKGLIQFLQQAEIDAVGISADDAETTCYAVEIAFHLGGTNYGSRQITVENIIKKLLRSAMCLCGNMGVSSGEIIFASPKINPAVMTDLKEPLADINRMLHENGFMFNASIIANQDFYDIMMAPVLLISDDVADTTELFLRSYQLAGMFQQSSRDGKQIAISKATVPPCSTEGFVGKPLKEYILHGRPCSAKEIHAALIQATEAKRTLRYKDGNTFTDIWDTRNYTANSNLTGNLASGPLRGWSDAGIISIRIEIE